MKLSQRERSIARQARGIHNLYKHLHYTGDYKIDKAIHSIVEQFVDDCTISFDDVTVPENSPMSKEALLEVLINHLKKVDVDFQEYFDDPDVLFRRLAYLATSSHRSFENFFKLTLRLHQKDFLECACESVFLLIANPHLVQTSLESILTYRTGISHATVHTALNSKIKEIFIPKVQDYLTRFDLGQDNILFDLCKKRALFLSNNPYR